MKNLSIKNLIMGTAMAASLGIATVAGIAATSTVTDTAVVSTIIQPTKPSKLDLANMTEAEITAAKATFEANMTDEQKAEMVTREAERTAKEAAWAALSAEQKEEVYALADEATALQSKQNAKLVELGLMTAAQKTEFDTNAATRSATMRSEGKMPNCGGGMGGGKGGPMGEKSEEAPALTTSTETSKTAEATAIAELEASELATVVVE